MKDKIQAQIQNINEALAWIRQHKPEHYNKQFINLVDERRKLRRLAAALSDNPAIAAFGKSQVGKSYLMNCILQKETRFEKDASGQTVKETKPFMVEAAGKQYNFVEEINPIGDDKEATGVVTRFTSFSRDPQAYCADYPVLARLLTVKDLLLILCDSYFNDFDDYTTYGEAEITERCDALAEQYTAAPLSSPVLTSDDILDIREYFRAHINNAQIFLKTAFFSRIAMFVESVPDTEIASVFSPLWNDNAVFTDLFCRLLGVMRRCRFAHKIYLPIKAVLHEGIRENTVMSVECLKRLYAPAQSAVNVEAHVCESGSYVSVGTFAESELCAVAAEVDFRIPEDFLESTAHFDLSTMPADTRAKLGSGEVRMDILKENDLLDFPGARARQKQLISMLAGNTDALIYCFLRGKVAYLFNKYNEDFNINVLLFSHHNKDNDVTNLWQLLNSWVNNYVGNTPEARATTLQTTGGISPLFYVGTMFNLDMANSKNGTVGDTDNAISERWKGRFRTVLLDQCVRPGEWINNWTARGGKFKNSYVLRDYKFSTTIYEGFKETGHETGLCLEQGFNQDYYDRLRRTFTTNPEVSNLFADPALSWDVAATRNNDGALYIIQQIASVAKCINTTRHAQFAEQLTKRKANVYRLLKDYHVSDDVDELLNDNVRKAMAIMRELDFACNTDNYFFGHLIQALQISESECLKEVHRIITSGELNRVHDFKNYELIRKRCSNFVGCRTDEDKWNLLLQRYGFGTKEEALQYLERRSVKPEILFAGNQQPSLNSVVIATSVFNLWQQRLRNVDFLSKVTNSDDLFDPIVLGDLVDDIIATAEKLEIPEKLHTAIAEYVNVLDPATANESLVADLLASELSDFVVNFGFDKLTAEDVAKARAIAENRHLPTFDFIERERKSEYNEEELAAIFDNLNSGETSITPAFEDNYSSWVEYMFVSFIAHLNVPDYDVEANHQLADLLQRIA